MSHMCSPNPIRNSSRRPARLLLVPFALAGVALHAFPSPAQTQEAAGEAAQHTAEAGAKVLTLDDYGEWSRIRQVTLSDDGRWMSFRYERNDGGVTLHTRDVEGDADYTAENGGRAVFSGDTRWVGYMIEPSRDEVRALREGRPRDGAQAVGEERQPLPTHFELVNLQTGETQRWEGVSSFVFSENSTHVAIHKQPAAQAGRQGAGGLGTPGRGTPGRGIPGRGRRRGSRGGDGDPADEEAGHDGRDLILLTLGSDVTQNIGNVSEFAFNEPGSVLAYTVDARNRSGNGLYAMDLSRGLVAPLSTGDARYAKLTWDEGGTSLAVLKGTKPEGKTERVNSLLAYRNVVERMGTGPGRPDGRGVLEYDPSSDPSFPAAMVLSELGGVQWSEDGTRIFLGIKEQDAEIEDEDEDEPRANVDVWHWRDTRLQTQQMVQAEQDRRRTWGSVFNVGERRFIRLENDEMRSVTTVPDSRWALGRDDSRYRGGVEEFRGRADYYRVDLDSGERSLMADGVVRTMGTSPDSRVFLSLQSEHVIAHDMETGQETDLTEGSGIDFVNRDFDQPREAPTWGVAGWTADGQSVLLNQKYDLWRVALDGSGAANLTGGMGEDERIRFRVEDLDDEDDFVDTSGPVILSAYGDWTKKSGFFRAREGRAPAELVWGDYSYGDLTKAEDADRVVFTRQTFTEFPDYWVSDLELDDPERVTDANPQRAEYAWGRRVLIDYTDGRGNELQATLALPPGYEEGRQYPMLVYFYEKMSQRHNLFSMPVYDDRPHISTYASNGYLVLQPDIIYEDGRPGSSALDDVTSAVQRVIDLGYADPDHIGLQGHSWGGYQSSYIVTQTDMFAAVVTGAPLTNLVSMHNVVYKRTGFGNGPLIQWSQGRMGVTPWEDLDLYRDQSPVHNAEGITSPFLILQGTEDGAVDWLQGLEFYTTARRLGKEVIFLSYPDEPHHLQKEENQKDFQTRMKQYFDHFLIGAPAPIWMEDGIPFLQKGRIGPKEMKPIS